VETVEDINFIDHAMQGQLVHVAGPLGNVPVLEDAEMGLSIRGTSLDRVVEMYQWVQKTHKRKSNKRTVTVRFHALPATELAMHDGACRPTHTSWNGLIKSWTAPTSPNLGMITPAACPSSPFPAAQAG